MNADGSGAYSLLVDGDNPRTLVVVAKKREKTKKGK